MKICIAQTRPFKGDIEKNVEAHLRLVQQAVAHQARLVVFPELSLTGYEPTLAHALATLPSDSRFSALQAISNTQHITICAGLPIPSMLGIQIGMAIFQPHQPPQYYCKQHLHSDEFPFFVPGVGQVMLTIGQEKIAPAICYESLLPAHASNAVGLGAGIYMASVAKSANGVAKAFIHYPEIAKKHALMVLMANCVGPCDDFNSVGQSSVWNKRGERVGMLDDLSEGILLFDTDSEEGIALVG